MAFCGEMFDKMGNEGDYLDKVVFSDEATFCLNGYVNLHDVRM